MSIYKSALPITSFFYIFAHIGFNEKLNCCTLNLLNPNLRERPKCHKPLCLSGETYKAYTSYVDGNLLSSCLLPCTTFHTNIRFETERFNPGNKIVLTFANKIQVTTTDFLPFHLSTLLSDLGGSMGLWLGLGVLQAGQLVLTFVLPAIRSGA